MQAIDHLTTECAYEHWHRMLFARFLAETELLIEPKSGIAISLAECQELARDGGRDWLELAAEFAQRMLPQIFRSGDPVLEVALPPETRSALEDLMKALPGEVFLADDSLGWVYQYWQADLKEAINRSEKKIGAEELPAVTQLFTEDYMVLFLLHNTLGAWWAGRVLADNPGLAETAVSEEELRSACALGGVEWKYLRFVREGDQPWRPAAGAFEGWPKSAKDITLLDPCMGSGHFLVFALPMLAALRAREDGTAPETATLAVLRDNLFGLEIDPRCTQIAAFNLALAAWRRLGYRALPALHLACSGLSLGMNKAEWLKLAERAAAELPMPPKTDLLGSEDNLFSDAMKRGFERLYELFSRAPWLGSLIDPRAAGRDLVEYGFADLEPILARVMAKAATAELAEMAVAAQGLAKAAEILAGRFTLVATNVPYLNRGKQDAILQEYCERTFFDARQNLAGTMVARGLRFLKEGGTAAVVTINELLFQKSHTEFRRRLLRDTYWNCVTRLGPGAFEAISGEVVNVCVLIISNEHPTNGSPFFAMDVGQSGSPLEKAGSLSSQASGAASQAAQLNNPDARISIGAAHLGTHLSDFVDCHQGLATGDLGRFGRRFWEISAFRDGWVPWQGTVEKTTLLGGRSNALLWQEGRGVLHAFNEENKAVRKNTHLRGIHVRGKLGVLVTQMGALPATLYTGEHYDDNTTVLAPKDIGDLPGIWAYCSSEEYSRAVRKVDSSLKVPANTLAKVPYDRDRWSALGRKMLPYWDDKPRIDHSTQWLFNGHPNLADSPLQVSVARMVGYRWPRQSGSAFAGYPALEPDGLEKHAERDGIVSLSSMKGEQPASARLTELLADAMSGDWSAIKLNSILAQVGYAGKTLDDWLRDGFFEQHCAHFQQRPFVWHIWDGRRDGFHALVNYHRLAAPNREGRRTLEKLLYTYLCDWLDRQRADQSAGVEGADARVAASERLRTELTNILSGEPPYDLFVRWKPLAEQAIGWEPDLNDGVRLNIRPFIAAKPLGARAKGTCILRTTPKIKWEKDRGKEPQRPREDFPWFWGWDGSTENFEGVKTFDGNRWNDLHYSHSFKETSRARSKK